jgi:hypothetical protein
MNMPTDPPGRPRYPNFHDHSSSGVFIELELNRSRKEFGVRLQPGEGG